MSFAAKPADRLFEQRGAVPQPQPLRSNDDDGYGGGKNNNNRNNHNHYYDDYEDDEDDDAQFKPSTFNREAVLSKFLPAFDIFGRRLPAEADPDSSSAAAAAGDGGAFSSGSFAPHGGGAAGVGADGGGGGSSSSRRNHPNSSSSLASDNEQRIQEATRLGNSLQRLEAFRRRARAEERLHHAARQEQAKVDGLWDAASKVVRHRRHPYAVRSIRCVNA
jgi:hypothetical protein